MDLVFAPNQIETWPIARLRPYARNAKMHGDEQVAKIAASMAKFGWTVPCLVADDGELIAGHGRVLAATMLAAEIDFGTRLATEPVLTGPAIVDASNVEVTMQGVEKGAR